MRAIEKKMISALRNGREFSESNTHVTNTTTGARVYLHGVHIATVTRDAVTVTNCGGWRSDVTRNRLNAILCTFTREGLRRHNWALEWVGGTKDGELFEPCTIKRTA